MSGTARGPMRRLLPDDVVVVETTGDVDPGTMHPLEAAVVRDATQARLREFATVRHCARLALGLSGQPAEPVLPGPHRRPVWPTGFVGSMTHCPGYRAAAVAPEGAVVSVGIDAEVAEALPMGVDDLVLLAAERAMVARLQGVHPRLPWDRLVFSAKESVFKAVSGVTGPWRGFEDCRVAVEADGTFAATVRTDGQTIDAIDGCWGTWKGLLLTAVCLRPSGPGGTPQDAIGESRPRHAQPSHPSGPDTPPHPARR